LIEPKDKKLYYCSAGKTAGSLNQYRFSEYEEQAATDGQNKSVECV
jgi:hypothetical protein